MQTLMSDLIDSREPPAPEPEAEPTRYFDIKLTFTEHTLARLHQLAEQHSAPLPTVIEQLLTMHDQQSL